MLREESDVASTKLQVSLLSPYGAIGELNFEGVILPIVSMGVKLH